VLVSNGIKAHLVGNIGTPILSVSPAQDEILVVEMSSYQLDLIDRTKFDVGVLLNVTEDHLDHHGSMERYIQAKMRLFKNHGHEEVAVLGMDNEVTKQACSILKQRHIKTIEFSAVSKVKGGIAVLDSVVYDDINHAQTTLAENKALRGEHNAENIAACYAVLCSRLQGADIASAIASFKGLPHRIQYVGTHDNIDFINDSKATNADSTEKALKMFDNVYWIAGGLPKTDGIEPLRPLFSKVRKAFLIGTAQEEFARTLEEEGVSFIKAGSLESAFKLAVEEAERDTSDQTKVVLLSPACASWDQWKSFEERGNKFIHLTEQYCHP
jgi:UDP-N-acetylmuramoylalanine--D-glutamate ligase